MKQAAKKMALASMVGAGMLVAASAAQAGFVITDTATVAGANTVYVFSALDDGTLTSPGNDTGTNLLALNSTITTSAPMLIQLLDTNLDGSPDANIVGIGQDFGSTAGTFQFIADQSSFNTGLAAATPTPFTSKKVGKTITPIDPSYTNQTVTSLNEQGFASGFQDVNGKNGIEADATAGPQPFANVVVPTGTAVSISGTLGGDTGTPFAFAVTIPGTGTGTITTATSPTTPTTPTTTTSGSTPTTAVTNPIVSLTAASAGNPTGFGANVGTLTVTGHNGSYTLGHLVITPTASGFAEAHTFNPTSDPELYGLDVLVGGQQASAADLAILLADVNASGAALGGLVATLTSPSAAFPGADNFFLTAATPPSGDNFLGFNLANATGLSGSATVSEIDVVPEPTSIGLMLGAAALLAGRRRKTA